MGLRSRKFAKKPHHKISIASLLLTILFILVFFSLLAYYYLSRDKVLNKLYKEIDVLNNEIRNLTRVENNKVLNFGHESESEGGDSRYWERDDRIRDLDIVEEYNASSVQQGGGGGGGGGEDSKEDRRDELKLYEKEFEASLKNVGQSTGENSYRHSLSNDQVQEFQNDDDNGIDDEYDDAIDSQDARVTNRDDGISDLGNQSGDKESHKIFANGSRDESSQVSDGVGLDFRRDSLNKGQFINGSTSSDKGFDLKKSPKHRKFSGSNCEMKFLNSTAQLVEPVENADFSRFSLQYTDVEERPSGQEDWTPSFCGHQSLKEREESFYARDQKINCGFVKGPEGSPSTGFDLDTDDMRYMSRCHIAVSSCIFGNSDNLRSPFNKTVTRLSRKHVCFVMFMDEYTLQTLSLEGQKPDESGFIGLWRIVVVKNLPFADMRRVGKIPKLLPHRLFPSSRYSIWLDSKLRLERDPLLILEYFLWRKGHEYAISKHYRRHCVWEEVAQNKRLNKFNHTIIDEQFLFYQADGLEKFNASDPNKLLPSNVPEGSVIIRAHTPMSNLFSCLWFNEVDRFTPRDQLSFAYVFHKLRRMNPDKPFHFNMFKDCERRDIAKLFRHKAEENRNVSQQATGRK